MAKKKLLVAAILVGAFAAVLLWLYAEQLDDEHKELIADQVEVVKAARNIPAGTPLTKDRITTEKVPRKFLPPNPLLESELNIYLGTPVAVNVEEIDGFVTMNTRKMEDLKKGSHTIVAFSSIDYDAGLTEDIFTERYLKNPPRKFIK